MESLCYEARIAHRFKKFHGFRGCASHQAYAALLSYSLVRPGARIYLRSLRFVYFALLCSSPCIVPYGCLTSFEHSKPACTRRRPLLEIIGCSLACRCPFWRITGMDDCSLTHQLPLRWIPRMNNCSKFSRTATKWVKHGEFREFREWGGCSKTVCKRTQALNAPLTKGIGRNQWIKFNRRLQWEFCDIYNQAKVVYSLWRLSGGSWAEHFGRDWRCKGSEILGRDSYAIAAGWKITCGVEATQEIKSCRGTHIWNV